MVFKIISRFTQLLTQRLTLFANVELYVLRTKAQIL